METTTVAPEGQRQALGGVLAGTGMQVGMGVGKNAKCPQCHTLAGIWILFCRKT